MEEVIEELCEQDRRLPVVVASVPYGQDAEAWTKQVVEPVFRNLSGLAVMYVLRPEAQQSFNAALEHHPVFGVASAPTFPAWTRPGSPTPSVTP